MTAWHHAYNGVPTTRKHQKNGKNGLGGDYPPVRHDHLLPNGLSGELHVSIKVASPTVPGQRTAKGQVVVSSRSGAVGGAMDWEDATIPATTLKGVLSSAYEAVTASRMRVFSGNDHVLTHRRTSQEAAILYPVFLVADRKTSGGTGLRARIMLGRNQRPENGTWDRLPCLCAAVLPDSEKSRTALYDKSGQLMYSGATKKRKRKYHNKKGPQHVRERLSQLRDATPHGSQVTFTAQEEDFYKTKRLIVSSVKGERFCGTVGHSKSPAPKAPYTPATSSASPRRAPILSLTPSTTSSSSSTQRRTGRTGIFQPKYSRTSSRSSTATWRTSAPSNARKRTVAAPAHRRRPRPAARTPQTPGSSTRSSTGRTVGRVSRPTVRRSSGT